MTQRAVAKRARVSQATVARCEAGETGDLPLRLVVAVINAVGGSVSFKAHWKGAGLDRLLDEAHASIVNRVVELLIAHGWTVVPEATFSIFGERGSVDILAYHPAHRALLVIEVKSLVPDMQQMLSGIDRKVRLAPRLAAERGWQVATISRLLVLSDDPTDRRRVARYAATINQTMPARTVEIRRWLPNPDHALGGVWFLAESAAQNHREKAGREEGSPRGDSPGFAA